MTSTGKKTMSVVGAAFLGVGAMVGAGIFALLGEAGAVAGSAVWVSFPLGGVVAGLLGYVVAQLGATYPSGGGLITYLIKGYGPGHVSAVVSWLLYFAALIVTSMVALSFGNYGAALFFGDDAAGAWVNVLASAVIVAMVAINAISASAKVQSGIVLLLAVFAIFIVVTLADANWELLAPSTYPSTADIVASVALTFFAYIGFSVISFTAADLRDPRRELPRAMYLGVGLTAAIYVLISLGTFGALTTRRGPAVRRHGARPRRRAGAGRGRLHDDVDRGAARDLVVGQRQPVRRREHHRAAREGADLPPFFGGRALGGPKGLVISAAGVLLLANVFDLTAIAQIGFVVAMVIFVMLGVAALRLRRETGSSAVVIVTAMAMTTLVLVLFMADTLQNDPATFAWTIVIALLALLLEGFWSRFHDREEAAAGSPPPRTASR